MSSALRILVIDDEPGVRDILSELLTEEGHDVAIAPDGVAGLALFSERSFDLVITDLTMPQMSGLAVVLEVRRLAPCAVCILTSGWTERPVPGGLDVSVADMVLQKPFQFDQVLDSVKRAGELHHQRIAATVARHGT